MLLSAVSEMCASLNLSVATEACQKYMFSLLHSDYFVIVPSCILFFSDSKKGSIKYITLQNKERFCCDSYKCDVVKMIFDDFLLDI